MEGERTLGEAERLEARARDVEGDSDNPLRVSAANRLYEQAAALRAEATRTEPMTGPDDGMVERAADAVHRCGVAMLTRDDARRCARAAVAALSPLKGVREALPELAW